jgi:hypothetical protein
MKLSNIDLLRHGATVAFSRVEVLMRGLLILGQRLVVFRAEREKGEIGRQLLRFAILETVVL